MPTKLHYYLVLFVDLRNSKCFEKEMSDMDLDTFQLVNKLKGEPFQILNKRYIRTKCLV